MDKKYLTALPVYNEVDSVDEVLYQVTWFSPHVLVVDDGSDDGTAEKLMARDDVTVVTHSTNRGYGAALQTAFQYAIKNGYEYLVTIDCDGQHEPQRIRQFVAACDETGADIVSGSRYLESFSEDTPPPQERQQINYKITKHLNDCLGFGLTDTFCGFKAYSVEALKKLQITETGYAMPLELWVQAQCAQLSVVEVAVPRIYLDESRSFGGHLDDGNTRLKYYYDVIEKAMQALPQECSELRHRVG